MRLVFVETPAFARDRPGHLDDEEFAYLQAALLLAPDAGPVIPGTGGFRKLRWRDSKRSKGKRGGLRVVYYWVQDLEQVWLFAIYSKGDIEDLTAAERRLLKLEISEELRAKRGHW